MPSKIQLDENLWFLYICIQKSDLKSIDFAAVGQATNLKPPAARMRYTRLRRQIESGTLIGTHGTPFLSSSPSTKRKGMGNDKAEDESEQEMGVNGERWIGKAGLKAERKVKTEVIVKEEGSDGFESSGSESDSEEWDSEDEVPLAKLRKAKLRIGYGPATQDHISYSFEARREGVGEALHQNRQVQGLVDHGVAAGRSGYQSMFPESAVPRYMPSTDGRQWQVMVPVSSVGIDSSDVAYGGWGNEFQGVAGGWGQIQQDTSGKPRKSV